MILEVLIQIFGTLGTLKKFQGCLNINIDCENRHEASFYIKEQTQKNKFEIWVSKTTILDPKKARFWF